jgi:hypothetical protein
MTKRTVVFIDDEDSFTKDWRMCLQERFNVDYHETIPDVDVLHNRLISMDACVVIQDIMMKDRSTRAENILAGIEFAEELSSTLVPLRIPLVFFSNRKFAEIEEEFADLDFPKNLLHYLAKPDVGYKTLVAEIERILVIASE